MTSKGFDVLLCTESVDEFCLMTLREYDGKPIKNVTAEDLGLEDAADIALVQQANDENRELFRIMLDVLPKDVVEVTATSRLSKTPACISAKGPISLGMEKYFASMPEESSGMPQVQHVLELNPAHPIFKTLSIALKDGDKDTIAQYALILHGQSLLAEGLAVPDMQAYANAVYNLM